MGQQTITHREQGKKWILPKFLRFNDLGKTPPNTPLKDMHVAWNYKVLGYRAPKAGEWYLSGARVAAYYVKHDFSKSDKYLVVEPIQMYKPKTVINWFPI